MLRRWRNCGRSSVCRASVFCNSRSAPIRRVHRSARIITAAIVAYTGRHDNDTTVGGWSGSGKGDRHTPEDVRQEHDFARAYLHFDDESEINWVMIRAVEASVADVATVPLQDVVGLGSMARMNLPGTVMGNWKWRYRPGALSGELSARLRSLVTLYELVTSRRMQWTNHHARSGRFGT